MSSRKILVISPRKGSDFSMDLLFSGLVKKFGAENIIDYPIQKRHRQGIPSLTGDINVDYGLERQSLCYTGQEPALGDYSEQEIFDLAKAGEIAYIFCDEQEESFRYYSQLRLSFFKIPVVVVAGHDRFWNEGPEFIRSQYYRDNLKHIFVDDWQSQYGEFGYVSLINLSTNYDHLWDVDNRDKYLQNKKYDICFIGYNSHPDRKTVIDHVKKNWGHLDNFLMLEERPNIMDEFCLRRNYFQAIAQSRICLNLKGASTCGRALRYYEIPYVGSFMLTQSFPAALLDQYDNRHCKVFDNLSQLDKTITWALENPEKREAMASKAHLWSRMKHTNIKRVEYILNKLKHEDTDL